MLCGITIQRANQSIPYVTNEDRELDLDDRIKLSASLCAQVSYRKADESIEKAEMIYARLIESKPCHASPFEHQATPARCKNDRSGNFIGWIQHRQNIPNNVCYSYASLNYESLNYETIRS
jgi:hypothetical protein